MAVNIEIGVNRKFFAVGNSIGVETNGDNGRSTSWNTNKKYNSNYGLWVGTDTPNQTTLSRITAVTVGAGGDSDHSGGIESVTPEKS